jgi:hypothetical protein
MVRLGNNELLYPANRPYHEKKDNGVLSGLNGTDVTIMRQNGAPTTRITRMYQCQQATNDGSVDQRRNWSMQATNNECTVKKKLLLKSVVATNRCDTPLRERVTQYGSVGSGPIPTGSKLFLTK